MKVWEAMGREEQEEEEVRREKYEDQNPRVLPKQRMM